MALLGGYEITGHPFCNLKMEGEMEMARPRIRRAQSSDRDALIELRAALWPEATVDGLAKELDEIFVNGTNGTLPMAIFVVDDENGAVAGFIEVGLRSHADGCDTRLPVGFVEGWFVAEPFRNRGIGRELIRAAEDWVHTQGCVEIASDALIDNELSVRAHEAMGFEVVDRCVHFRKAL
jgi:aminoglycoside 6'-N-acetyltransferase I